MAKRKGKKRELVTSLPEEYQLVLGYALSDRIRKMFAILEDEELEFSLFCQASNEVVLLQKFIRQYGIPVECEILSKKIY